MSDIFVGWLKTASYQALTELSLLVVKYIWPGILITIQRVAGVLSNWFINVLEILIFFSVLEPEKDDLATLSITSILVRLATASSVYMCSAYRANSIVTEFDLTKGMFLSTDTWTQWGLATIVQYLNTVTMLATFRLIVFGSMLAFYLVKQIVAYFWPEPV